VQIGPPGPGALCLFRSSFWIFLELKRRPHSILKLRQKTNVFTVKELFQNFVWKKLLFTREFFINVVLII
jgi:hypothetical protein